MSAKAVEVRVTGSVQGVFFRARCAEKAQQSGVTGWVRNDADGSVVAHFEGPSQAVDELVAWCGHGPERARVAGVRVHDAPAEDMGGFEVVD